ncbi:MAG: hypothetical protein ACLTDV_09265 [Eubacterium sp.]
MLFLDTIGVTKDGSGWLYLHGGIFDANADTIAANEAGWWKIRNGLVDFSYTGLAYNGDRMVLPAKWSGRL